MWDALYKDYLSIWEKQIVLFHIQFVYLLFIILFLNYCDKFFCDKTIWTQCDAFLKYFLFRIRIRIFLSEKAYGTGLDRESLTELLGYSQQMTLIILGSLLIGYKLNFDDVSLKELKYKTIQSEDFNLLLISYLRVENMLL